MIATDAAGARLEGNGFVGEGAQVSKARAEETSG
jgi:hypothetical protein